MGYRLLITGGTSQIAMALAARQAALGRDVTVTASKEEGVEPLRRRYAEARIPAAVVAFDLDPAVPYGRALQELLGSGVDALVLNAAPPVKRFRRVHQFPAKEIDEALSLNVVGNFRLLQAVLPGMAQRRFGRLVFVSSAMVQQAASRHALYALTKSAVESLFTSVAIEYAAKNVFANVVRPGIIRTERTRRFWKNPEYLERAQRLIPAGALGRPEQVAEAFDPLLSETSYLNGSVLTVGGGLPILNLAGVGGEP
ncbi:MAG: SDR family oxidoreductase [Myxococcaceae bacterium]|nr:SDR family oxidoreductase [Myxococcaceae bacterium]